MAKVASVLKKTLKIIAWIVFSIVLLLVTVALLIQVPAVQQKLISIATTYISDKTHTQVEIKHISLSLPKSLSIEGLYLDDLQKDTLVYAEKLSVNFSLTDLMQHTIHLKNISLDNATIHLSRSEADTLFNYNFLLTAFSDTAKVEKKDTTGKTKWALQIDEIELNKIAFQYKDEYGGSSVQLYLGKLNLQMDKIDTDQQRFDIDDLLIENLVASILISKLSKKDDTKPEKPAPVLTARRVRINHSNLTFADSVHRQTIAAVINEFSLKELLADLQSEKIKLDEIKLAKSGVIYVRTGSTEKDTTAAPGGKKSNWAVTASSIELADNSFALSDNTKPVILHSFDPSHMRHEQLSLSAKDLFYSAGLTKVKIEKFSAKDANGFSILSFQTQFIMDPHSMEAAGLKLKTLASTMDASIRLSYSSLSSLKDSIGFLKVNAAMDHIRVKTSEVLYFSPQLASQAFFKETENITAVSGKVTGQVNNLKGENMYITTGSGTSVKTSFIIGGLPNKNLAYFYFPDLKVNTGRKDIEMIAGKAAIPQSIALPNQLSLLISFKGGIKAFTSTLGLSSDYGTAHVFAILDKEENFTANAEVGKFDLGLLLKNKEMFGPVTLSAQTKGKGLDKNTIRASIKANVSEFYLNKYSYKNLAIDGNIQGQRFEGKINLDDVNAAFDFDGLVNLNKGQEEYKFRFDLKGADLQKLHFTQDDMRIGLLAVSDLKGSSAATINGKAGISRIIISHNEKRYILDSLLFASINEKGRSELNVSSAVIGIRYSGTFSPVDLSKEMQKFTNNYFPLTDQLKDTASSQPQNFSFEIQLKNHPVLSEVFFPQLKEFEPGIIQGSFDSQKKELKLDATLRKIIYGSMSVDNFALNINSDAKAISYNLSCGELSNAQVKVENLSVAGQAADSVVTSTLSSTDENNVKKLQVSSSIAKNKGTYTMKISPDNFIIMNDRWTVAPDNYIAFNKTGFLVHDLDISKATSSIKVISVHDQFNDDLDINIKSLQIEDISRIIEKDTSLAKGTIDGHVLLKKVDSTYGLIANAAINNLVIREVPVGNFIVKAENPTTEKYSLEATLKGPDNDVSISGYYLPKATENAINIDADIRSLALKTVEVLSMGRITEASGTASGKFMVRGKASEPDITGSLTFNNASINPAALNSPMKLKHETIELKSDGIYFNSFTILDSNNSPAVINGNVKMNHFKDFRFGLDVSTTNFALFNTTAKNNPVYYGSMIIDSRIKVSGDMNLPVVNAKVKLKKGSNFTFAIPEKKLTTDKGEGVVVFNDSSHLDPILTRDETKAKEKTELTGLDISSIIEVDKEATLKLIIDPSSGDSLVVRGDAALSFALDPSGKMSLTGAYDLNEGSYLVSLESVLKRKFSIERGSTIIWNGDPLDADVNINAIYSVRASPVDLVADQLSDLSETEQSGFRQRYPFLVYLKLRGDLLHPEISFEIQLSPEDKGILGGAVNAKLNMLNEDPSALNKQVFALLVLGRFVQENPLQTETNAASTAARTTVSKFLSAQLNQLGSKLVPGVELNFDVQSYDEYNSGQSEGRTEVEVGIKKQLFDERLSVQVGGSVDVEGEKAKQNSASDITSDVSLEYKMSKDGRYRLKGFRHNQYEGALEGQLVETGAGLLYIRDFDKWKDFFRRPKKKEEAVKNNNK
ncbi:MAG: hypothetical protein JWO44_2412 [Bacteroidetes bacterium]|nr:hypothetical protein [Bacteroidota bacterium]